MSFLGNEKEQLLALDKDIRQLENEIKKQEGGRELLIEQLGTLVGVDKKAAPLIIKKAKIKKSKYRKDLEKDKERLEELLSQISEMIEENEYEDD